MAPQERAGEKNGKGRDKKRTGKNDSIHFQGVCREGKTKTNIKLPHVLLHARVRVHVFVLVLAFV